MPEDMVLGIPWYRNFWTTIVVAVVPEEFDEPLLLQAVAARASTATTARTRHAGWVRVLLTAGTLLLRCPLEHVRLARHD
jgi:hypothetical protein